MRRTQQEVCVTKIRYEQQIDALIAAAEMHRETYKRLCNKHGRPVRTRRVKGKRSKRQHPYECPVCLGWHLTTQERWEALDAESGGNRATTD